MSEFGRPEWLSEDGNTVSPERQAELDAWRAELKAELPDLHVDTRAPQVAKRVGEPSTRSVVVVTRSVPRRPRRGDQDRTGGFSRGL